MAGHRLEALNTTAEERSHVAEQAFVVVIRAVHASALTLLICGRIESAAPRVGQGVFSQPGN